MSNRRRRLYPVKWVSYDSRRFLASTGFQRLHKMPKNCSGKMRIIWGTMPRAMNWGGIAVPAKDRRASSQRSSHAKQDTLPLQQSRGAISAPIGGGRRKSEITTGRRFAAASVIIDDDIDGIAVDRRPAFREYIVRPEAGCRTTPFRDRVIVGGVAAGSRPSPTTTCRRPMAPRRYRYTRGERPDRAGRAALRAASFRLVE